LANPSIFICHFEPLFGEKSLKPLPGLACHSREGGNPLDFDHITWMPAFAGMTVVALQVCQAHYLA
jgi:hypothetical protein